MHLTYYQYRRPRYTTRVYLSSKTEELLSQYTNSEVIYLDTHNNEINNPEYAT